VSAGVMVVSGGITLLSIVVSGGIKVVSGFKKIVDIPVRQLLATKLPVKASPQYPVLPFSHIVNEESKYSHVPSSVTAKLL